jgi:DNA-binding CsgD family transcriptional regulator
VVKAKRALDYQMVVIPGHAGFTGRERGWIEEAPMLALSALSLKKPANEPGDEPLGQVETGTLANTLGDDVFALVCPDWGTPSLVLDASLGRVAYANWSCLKLLEGQAPACLAEGRLVFCSAEVNRRFYRVLEHTAGSSTEFAVVVGHCEGSISWFSVTIRNAHGFFRDVLQRSLPPARRSSRFVVIQFAVTGNFPDPAALAALAEACALSPAEAELLKFLACGRSISQIAKNRGVKLATMRQRMKNVLAKANCHRQTELIHLVMSLCPMAQNR